MNREDHATLYHVTSRSALASIGERGLDAGSFWTSNPDLADYYEETVIDEDSEPITLAITLDDLEALAVETGEIISPDEPGIAEPITTVLDMSEDDVIEAWGKAEGTWQECLDIIGSVRFDGVIPAEMLSIDTGNDMMLLSDYVSISEAYP